MLTKIIFLFSLFILSSGATAMQKNPDCFFNGTINGQKVKSFQCEITQAGTSPYLLLGISYQGSNLMVDLNGIGNKTGNKPFSLAVMQLVGKKISARFSDNKNQAVVPNKRFPSYLYFSGNFAAKDSQGQVLNINGIFAWNTDKLPTEGKNGNLSLQVGDITLPAAKVEIKSWNQAFQLTKISLVKPGETMTLTLDLATLNPGNHQGPGNKLTLMHMRITPEGKMSNDLYSASPISLNITNKNGKVQIHFNAKAKSAQKEIEVKGVFTE